MTDFVVILSTAPAGEVDRIARTLVEERLAACISISQVRSYFVWEGKLSEEIEDMMIIKTALDLEDKVKARIKDLHSYELPEVIVLPIIGGDEGYLKWIKQSVG
ncbi:MAG: divalent-cation tolerance protein CutA [Methanotrichaceae archaeon]|nr:divalent-cation tolerance protein CutA [Methanotrichaceae archaeon]MDD1758427.1 divalent-cation tolerance protein CutA [Methanotrichaceae archaeon]